MRPLPVPDRGGTLDALWPLVNIPVADRLMVLAWMLECLRTDTPHVVLNWWASKAAPRVRHSGHCGG